MIIPGGGPNIPIGIIWGAGLIKPRYSNAPSTKGALGLMNKAPKIPK